MKPYRIDRPAAVARLVEVQCRIRDMKEATRAVRTPHVFLGVRNGHAFAKKRMVLVRPGRDMTAEEGREFHALRREATALCTALAHARGRIHKSKLLSHPDGLIMVAVTMRMYQAPNLPAPVEVLVEEEQPAEEQPNYVVNAGGSE